MSSALQRIQQQAAAAAATSVDMNEAVSGGGGRLVAAGVYIGRLCEYIDLGMQPQEFQGKAKDPAPNIRLGVALFGTNPENPQDPTPYVLRSSDMSISRNEKAGTFKAFAALNYKRDPNIKHFAQFIGQAFIFHVEVKKSKTSGREYNTIAWDKTGPAIDAMTRQPYAVPELPDDLYRVFLWDYPTKEDWDALYIDGVNQEGKSKNFIQETILGALDYQGSPLQLLLEGGAALNKPVQAAAPAPQGVPTAPVAPAAPVAAPAAPAAPAVPVVAVPLPQTGTAPVVPAPTAAPVVPAQVVAPAPQTVAQTPASSETGTTTYPSSTPQEAPAVPALPVIPGQPA